MDSLITSASAAPLPDHVSAGLVVYPPQGTLGPRWQSSVQLVFIHRGSMTVWVDQQPFSAAHGTVTLLLPGHQERFAFSTVSETEHSWFHLTYNLPPPTLIARLEAASRTISTSQPMLELVKLALTIRHSPLPSAEMLLRSLGFAALWRFLFDNEQHSGDPTARQLHISVEQARRYIEANLEQNITLADLAAAGSVSSAHLIRLFRDYFNMTPIAYLWERRVQRGLELLRYTGLPVGVIAVQCGFKTSYHFSRRIREATQCSPQEIRYQFFARSAWE
jgi:AraC family transcriptional regulator of arabinose operon